MLKREIRRMVRIWRRLRVSDQISTMLIVVALVITVAGLAHAQPSQDTFNGRIDATVSAQDKRIERLETALNYAMVTLIANLVAHLVQISTQLRKRGEREDEPRVRVR